MPPAAGSVMNRPVMHPPTNTSSSSTGASRRTTDSKSARFGSATEESPKACAQLFLRKLPLARASVAQRIDQGQQFVEYRVLLCGFRRGLVQWLERDASYVALRIRPDWRKVAALSDLGVQRRGRVCRRYATGGLATLDWKRVFHAVDQKLFGCLQEGPPGLRIDQTGALKSPQGRMHLGGTQRQIAGHLGNRRTCAAVAHQFGEHDHVLRQQALRHSVF